MPFDGLLLHIAGSDAFAAAHIPGAICIVPAELVDGNPPAPGRLPSNERLQALFERIGYQPEQRIVVYDDEGGGWAGRMAWTLDIIGHDDWLYLNGGIHAWHAAGGTLAQGESTPPASANTPALSFDRGPIAEAEDVLKLIDQKDGLVWDVRSHGEYVGSKRNAARAGHIPGAVNIDWLALQNPDDHRRLYDDVESLLERHGITPDRDIVTHCQTHHRSGLSYMLARILGYPRIRAYHGSWSEWGNREDLPIATGS